MRYKMQGATNHFTAHKTRPTSADDTNLELDNNKYLMWGECHVDLILWGYFCLCQQLEQQLDLPYM